MRILIRLAVVGTALLVAAPATAATPTRPKAAVVKKLLKKHYLGSYPVDYPAYRYDWRLVSPLRYGASRRGTYLADGVPANTRTIVFPVLARSRYTVCSPDGTFKKDSITAKYVFFRDEFRQWTFRIKDEDRVIGASAAGECPVPTP